jgi:hypothetical protein
MKENIWAKGEIRAIFNHQIALGPVAKLIILIELRMRQFAEWNNELKNEVTRLIKLDEQQINNKCSNCSLCSKHSKKRKIRPNKYWNCKLSYIDQAIINLFKSKLNPEELKNLEDFRHLRNCFVHGNFVSLMESFNINPEGQQYLSDGKRNPLTKGQITQILLSENRNQMLPKLRVKADEVLKIIEDLMISECSID